MKLTKRRKIKITQLKNQGRIVFYDGKLNNWEIEFNGLKKWIMFRSLWINRLCYFV